ncbi:MAG: hypothetical protein AAB553_01950 [Patescibacteria group bacterium]
MSKNNILFTSIFLLLLSVSFVWQGTVHAQTPSTTPATTDNSSRIKELNDRIVELEGKVSDLRSQGNSLSSQIDAMDNQIKLTEYKIQSNEQQIMDLTLDIDSAGKRMENLEDSLEKVSETLLNRIVATYQNGGGGPMQMLLASGDAEDLITKANYLRIVQAHDKELLYNTQQARNDYANQKSLLEGKKKKVEDLKTELQGYTAQLDKDKATKQELLSVTKNDEARYQRMLSEARAQINSFKSFATSRVGSGASILPAQASPDGWYYNQRDERWGNGNMGSSGEKVWEVGCLATSIAMVMKKHGQGVTPADITSNGGYFFSNTAYMLIPWAGGKISSSWGFSQSAIDDKLSGGEPVIVGVKAGPFGTHFIVLKSGSGGSYVMNDPWNGTDLSFNQYYSTGQIFQYGWYN